MHEYSFVRIEGSLINELYAVAFLGKISITMQDLIILITIRKEYISVTIQITQFVPLKVF